MQVRHLRLSLEARENQLTCCNFLSLQLYLVTQLVYTYQMSGVLLRRACLDDCTAALAAVPGGSEVCEEASEALHQARLLARRASAHVQLGELAAATGDYEEASVIPRLMLAARKHGALEFRTRQQNATDPWCK